ncbi:MAG: hypothetical protein WBL19_01175 [Minisyncoccia bacterium]
MKNNQLQIAISIIAVAGLIVLFLLGRGTPQNADPEKTVSVNASQSDIVSEKAVHWHPELSVTIKGEKQPIPANIGIGMQYAGYPQYDSMMMMANMHTHDDSGMIHWEVMEGPVTKDEVTLAVFFGIWGKTFNKDCIFEYCNGAGGTVKMLVNGKENTEFENYVVKDKDKIEIIFD